MNFQQAFAGQLRFAAANIAYNLDFIPADKFDWKPGPKAGSAQEILNHSLGVIGQVGTLILGDEWQGKAKTPVTTIEEAKTQLVAVANSLAEKLANLPDEALERTVRTPFGARPLATLIQIVASDTMHHHGQIAYIQTLLGDDESHFDPALFAG